MNQKKQKPQKILITLGILFFIAWPFLFFFLMKPLIDIIPPQEAPRIVGYSAKELWIMFSLLLGPPLIGSVLILIAALKKR